MKIDPLVMNGEPFCHATRLTVRNLLEMRANGLTPSAILAQHPELRRVGVAEAFRFAAQNRDRYGDFFDDDGSLRGPGFSADEAAMFPEHLRELRGVVVQTSTGDGMLLAGG
ncbi:MAG: DUF433 domain-containing protein [Chloroflexota bacterium]|nr:DUF433 domain-containing protein [Chloroflexota bacterium]